MHAKTDLDRRIDAHAAAHAAAGTRADARACFVCATYDAIARRRERGPVAARARAAPSRPLPGAWPLWLVD